MPQAGSGLMDRATLIEPAVRGSPRGLSSEEARRTLTEFGPNTVSEAVPPRWRTYLAKFWSPIAWLLEIAMVGEIGLCQYGEGAVIAGFLPLHAPFGFI